LTAEVTRRTGERVSAPACAVVRGRVAAIAPALRAPDVRGRGLGEAVDVVEARAVTEDDGDAGADVEGVVEGVAVFGVQIGSRSSCSRCTIRTASPLLRAVMPDSTWAWNAGYRSDILMSVLR
jgi:hypothetical protein